MDLWCTAPSTVPCLDAMPPPPGLGDVICCRAWMRKAFLCLPTCCKPQVIPVTVMPSPCAWLSGARWAPLALSWGGGDVDLCCWGFALFVRTDVLHRLQVSMLSAGLSNASCPASWMLLQSRWEQHVLSGLCWAWTRTLNTDGDVPACFWLSTLPH